ncbi:MAG: glycine/sarcosine/betaine reductase selenoprotein B family protein [Candidatus Rokubacteria bacterium]|nr:glycine/sarcosine/betaine reductase selenoprotein B family protein [Candidatus Rokubacteria bacterium]
MSGPLRVVHYVNQFFGGIGGEDQAHVGVTVRAGAVGPGRVLETALGDGARVEATIICGDNFAHERAEDVAPAVAARTGNRKQDLVSPVNPRVSGLWAARGAAR